MKYILLFICLIKISISSYLPLKKSNGFEDNVCAYYFNDVNYVRTCKDGQYCKEVGESTSFCEDKPTSITLKGLDEKCDSKYECEDNLNWYSGQCTRRDNTLVNCGTGQEAHKTKNGWVCKDTAISNYCYYQDDSTYSSGRTYEPDYFKVCGEITFGSNTLPNNKGVIYYPVKIESTYIGTVDDGKYVYNALACKSGYALPFYPGSSLNDPSLLSTNKNNMYLRCVSVNGIDNNHSDKCIIKYDNDKIYNIKQLKERLYENLSPSDPNYYDQLVIPYVNFNDFCDENLLTKLELFSKYINVFTKDKQEKCATKDNYNEPYTCNDNELRKWFYYYNHPKHYLLYYKEKGNDVANYLIQKDYPLYESSKFLCIKYFIGLLFLLLF